MRCVILLAAAVWLLGAESMRYDLAPAAGAKVALEVEKTGLWSGRKHLFLFARYRGTLEYDREHPERSQVRFAVESKSVTNQDTWASEKDRQKVIQFTLTEMLAADRYPEIVFSSERIVPKGPDQAEAQGTLTIRGIAKPVVVQVKAKGELWFEGSARFRMTDYGLKPPKAALGAIGTKDEMRLDFVLQGLRPAAR